MESKPTILLVEDEPQTAEAVASLCKEELHASLTMVRDGIAGLETALRDSFSLVVLDVGLPGKSGTDVCRELRRQKPDQLILMLTARGEELDKVLGLELGADDYMTKPFSSRELVARLRALLRRQRPVVATTEILRYGPLEIDRESRRLWKNKVPVNVTFIEFELLATLAEFPGRTFSRDKLSSLVLGYSSGEYDGAVAAHISRLRAKIEDNPASPRLLFTVRGFGYRLAAPDELGPGAAPDAPDGGDQ